MSTPAPGRPRSERARVAILEAAHDLLVEGGLQAATIEAIAARAGVSKVTIYKWWPTRGAVAVDAYFHANEATIRFDDTGDVAADLIGQVSTLIDAFRTRQGQLMAELIGAAQTDAKLAQDLLDRWVLPRRTASTAVLERAIARGELRPDLDPDIVLDEIYGAVYFRVLIGHRSLEPTLAADLVHNVLDGIRAR